MRILSKKKCDEILKRITANEIIAINCDRNDIEAWTKATENRAEIAFLVGGIKGMDKVQNTVKSWGKQTRVKAIAEMKELVRGHKYTNAEDGTTVEEMLKDENTEKKYAWYLSRNQCCDWMLHRLDEIEERLKEAGE